MSDAKVSEVKHTAGPWRVVIEHHRLHVYPRSPFDENKNAGHDISLPMHEHRSGAGRGTEVNWRGFDDEQLANARLIAAAPDLLEACEAARLTYRALARNHKMIIEAMQAKGWPSNWLTQEIEKAAKVEAAIAKAEGR